MQAAKHGDLVPGKHLQTYQEAEIASTALTVASNDAKTVYDHFRRMSEEFRYDTLDSEPVQQLLAASHRNSMDQHGAKALLKQFCRRN